jgi:hypothetical protein
MDYNNIRKLLDKYWEGESSLQEETQLRDFFAGNNVPEDLKSYQPLFQFFQMEQKKNLNGDFDERLIQQLESSQNATAKVRNLPYYLMRVAAAGLLLFSIYFVNEQWNQAQYEAVASEEMTPEEVYAQTKQALLLVSSKLNKGTDVVNDGMSKMNKATHVIK